MVSFEVFKRSPQPLKAGIVATAAFRRFLVFSMYIPASSVNVVTMTPSPAFLSVMRNVPPLAFEPPGPPRLLGVLMMKVGHHHRGVHGPLVNAAFKAHGLQGPFRQLPCGCYSSPSLRMERRIHVVAVLGKEPRTHVVVLFEVGAALE